MSPKLKSELISFAHTFLAIFIPLLLVSLDSLDFTNLSREALLAFGVGLLRSTIKAMSNFYFAPKA